MTNRAITKRKAIVMALVTPAVLSSASSATGAAPSRELLAAIAAHQAAWQAFEDICSTQDELDPRFDPARKDEYQALDAIALEKRFSLLVHPTSTVADIRAKAQHMLNHGNGDFSYLEWEDIFYFLKSLGAREL